MSGAAPYGKGRGTAETYSLFRGVLPFEAAAFLGSFLLFSLELIAAKLLLPTFGGAACVWTASLMFFQGVLLLGYLYDQAFLSRFTSAASARLHLLALAAPLLFFPLSVSSSPAGGAPLSRLLETLSLSIGVPFFALSTATPMLQNWLGRGKRELQENPYLIYAASNAGALAALLAYPALFEPLLTLKAQTRCWQALYGLFALLNFLCLPQRNAEEAPAAAPYGKGRGTAPEDRRLTLAWVFLSLGPSAALLAATNLLSLDFAAVPLLWVVPLALYLLTLMLSFKRRPWYPRRLGLAVAFVMLVWAAAALATVGFSGGLAAQWDSARRLWVVNKFVFLCAALFLLCLVCHRALAQSKPEGRRAAPFYVSVAAGGWLGGFLIAVLMPWLGRRSGMPELDWLVAGGLSLAALAAWGVNWGREWATAFSTLLIFLALTFGLYFAKSSALAGRARLSFRNFYGYYAVSDTDEVRKFFHGNTLHGLQYLDPAKAEIPLLYYGRTAPFGQLWREFGAGFRTVGVVGLGVGVIAAYGRPGQEIDFYELDADVAEMAERDFSFLRSSAARVRVVAGDGRLSLESREAAYDLLVLDAFSGGAIPVHLLTKEAFELYLRRLSPGGLIAIQITNRFLNLRPALAALSRELGLFGAAKAVYPADLSKEERYYSSWIVLSRDAGKIERLKLAGWEDLGRRGAGVRAWSDQYASVWAVLGR